MLESIARPALAAVLAVGAGACTTSPEPTRGPEPTPALEPTPAPPTQVSETPVVEPPDDDAPDPPTAPPPDPPVGPGSMITKVDPDTLLRSSGPWMPSNDPDRADSDPVTTYTDGNDEWLLFVQRPFTWANEQYVLVLWAVNDEGDVDGALLHEQSGAWKVLWVKEPLIEDAGLLQSPDALEMPFFELGGDRIAVLHQPHILACGAAPCYPEDDFMRTRLFEITTNGLRPLWELTSGPRCEVEGTKFAPDWQTKGYNCRVGLQPSGGRYQDLVVRVWLGRKKPKKTVYRLVDNTYRRRR